MKIVIYWRGRYIKVFDYIKTDKFLERCPFCGGEAALAVHVYEPDCGEDQNSFGVGCKRRNCWAEIDSDQCYHESIEKAIEMWNRRK